MDLVSIEVGLSGGLLYKHTRLHLQHLQNLVCATEYNVWNVTQMRIQWMQSQTNMLKRR